MVRSRRQSPCADGRIAKAIDVPARRINEIVHGKRGITADTALRLSRALGLSDMFFINMQAHYDAEIAREHLATALATIERICVAGEWTFSRAVCSFAVDDETAADDAADERPAAAGSALTAALEAPVPVDADSWGSDRRAEWRVSAVAVRQQPVIPPCSAGSLRWRRASPSAASGLPTGSWKPSGSHTERLDLSARPSRATNTSATLCRTGLGNTDAVARCNCGPETACR